MVVGDGTAPDGTRKWLLKVDGGNAVEAVFIPEDGRGTLRVQPGRLRSTGRHPAGLQPEPDRGRRRPALARQPALNSPGGQSGISNVVFMGMGEPMLNLNAVIPARA